MEDPSFPCCYLLIWMSVVKCVELMTFKNDVFPMNL